MTAPQLFTSPADVPVEASALLSSDGLYRYVLTRAWETGPQLVTWVMLNPSTADGAVDDATIRKVIGFSRRWDMDELVVVNLFGWRATKPADLMRAPDPVGPFNRAAVRYWISRAHLVVAGWGRHATAPALRQHDVISRAQEAAREAGKALQCLGTNADGSPCHPLFRPYETPLVPWRA